MRRSSSCWILPAKHLNLPQHLGLQKVLWEGLPVDPTQSLLRRALCVIPKIKLGSCFQEWVTWSSPELPETATG